MAHRAGNYIPQSREYMPMYTFGHNSLGNLLCFFEPSNFEEKLSLVEAYILLNDFNSAENLIEQIYDDIKHIDQFCEQKIPQNNPNLNSDQNEIISSAPSFSADACGGSGSDSVSSSSSGSIDEKLEEPIPNDSQPPLKPLSSTDSSSSNTSRNEINRIPINCTKIEMEQRVYSLRTMLKNNSIIIRTLKTSAYDANTTGEGTNFPLVRPDPLPTPEERAAAKKLKELQRQSRK